MRDIDYFFMFGFVVVAFYFCYVWVYLGVYRQIITRNIAKQESEIELLRKQLVFADSPFKKKECYER